MIHAKSSTAATDECCVSQPPSVPEMPGHIAKGLYAKYRALQPHVLQSHEEASQVRRLFESLFA
eukprot:COSAG01_NODE_11066_length_2016_cov_1.194575_2_plen_64_part_00